MLAFQLARDQAVLSLQRDEGGQIPGAAQPERIHQAVGGVVRAADVEHFALRDQIVERAQDLILRRVDVLHVDLVEVEVIGAPAAPRLCSTQRMIR